MRTIVRLACFGYWMLLTVLLLVPDPAALVGLRRVPTFPWGKFGVHLSFFVVLSVLVCSVWWSKPLRWPMIGLLAIYGITTESLQLLVPHRTARVMDGIENLLGIAIGVGVYLLAQSLIGSREPDRQAGSPDRFAEGETPTAGGSLAPPSPRGPAGYPARRRES